jgi:hypothetical protein
MMESPGGDSGSARKKNMSRSYSAAEVIETEPCIPSSAKDSFEELALERLVKRRNSFTEKSRGPKPTVSRANTPNMFMALIGDKEMSDPEISSSSEDEMTTSKESG